MPARKKFDKLIIKHEYTEEASEKDTVNKEKYEAKFAEKPKKTHTYFFRPAERDSGNGKVYAVGFIDVYIPFLAAFLLCLINRFLTQAGAYEGLDILTASAIKCVTYPVIFVLPVIVFCRIRKKSMKSSMGLYSFSASHIPFTVISLLLLIFVIAAEKIAIAYFFPVTEAEQLVNLSSSSDKLWTILAYAIFPAICEELFLRGLIQNGISEKAGGISGIVVSALAFALIHLDFRYFVVYLSTGFIIAVCAHVTHSVIPAIILHVLNNMFSLVFSARLSFIASERTGNTLLLIILVLVIFILALFYLKSLENLCIKKAYAEELKKSQESDGDVDNKRSRKLYRIFSDEGYTLHKFLRVLFSPAMIIAAILFMFAVI